MSSKKRTMITPNLLFLISASLLIPSPHFFQTCYAADCSPSSCGIIPNISFPFRLSSDPKHCGDPKYELVCDNNVTTVHIHNHTNYVKAIDYHTSTIRLADVFAINSNTCSFPVYSAYNQVFYYSNGVHVSIISCRHPLHNSSLFTQFTECGYHTYIKAGELQLTDMDYMCTINSVVTTSWNFTDLNNVVSPSEMHQALLYGTNYTWPEFMCGKCFNEEDMSCYFGPDGKANCDKHISYLAYKWGKNTALDSYIYTSFKLLQFNF